MPIFCNACELFLAEKWEDVPPGPCPKCGFTTHVWYPLEQEFALRISNRSRSRPAGGGRWVYQGQERHSLFLATGRLHYIDRIIDRIKGEYHERIIDKETGQVVREVHELLSQHRHRGSAKHGGTTSDTEGGAA